MEDVLDHVPLDVTHESLVQALRTAEEDALVTFASMCLFKVVPLIEARSGRPLEDRVSQRMRLLEVDRVFLTEMLVALRDILEPPLEESVCGELEEACAMAAEMVWRAFQDYFQIKEWADWCSTLVLDIHQEFDALLYPRDEDAPIFYPAPEQPELTPMEALEMRDQVTALNLLRRGGGDDQLRALNESGKSRVASALSRIGADGQS